MPLVTVTTPFNLTSVTTAASIVHLHPKSIYRMISEGRLKAYGRPGYYRVNLSDLLPNVEPNGLKNSNDLSEACRRSANKRWEGKRKRDKQSTSELAPTE
jgi:hypothetical protein